MTSADLDPELLERFLIEYCSLGVQMTEPVEDWVLRAGEACVAQGLDEIGGSLFEHARREAGKHRLRIIDTHKLVLSHNDRYRKKLSASALISRAPTRAVRRYIELHEQGIDGDLPTRLIAVELELEGLLSVVLPKMLAHWRCILGGGIVDALTFLEARAPADAGHAHFNSRLAYRVLHARPDLAPDMARVGAEALVVYTAFLEECWEAARQRV